jgi:hypothetical protein
MIIFLILPMRIQDKLSMMLSIFFVLPIYQLILVDILPASEEESSLEHLINNIFYLILVIIGVCLIS